jgi:hypothetical protein
MKLFMGQEPEISEMDLPSVPEEEPIERPPYYDIMIHTPVEGRSHFPVSKTRQSQM